MNTQSHVDGGKVAATIFSLAALLIPEYAFTQAASPLDPNATVKATQYDSPLNDFRAFDPDEDRRSWVEANRRVEEIGGWRTYLRQANPPKKSGRTKTEQARPMDQQK